MPVSAAAVASSAGLATPSPQEKPLLTWRCAKPKSEIPTLVRHAHEQPLPGGPLERQVYDRPSREQDPEDEPVHAPCRAPPGTDLPPALQHPHHPLLARAASSPTATPVPAAAHQVHPPVGPPEHVGGLLAPPDGLAAPSGQLRPSGEPGGVRQVLGDGPLGLSGGKERLLEAGRARGVAVDLRDRRREQAPSSPTGGAPGFALSGAQRGEKVGPVRYNPAVRASVLYPPNPRRTASVWRLAVGPSEGPRQGALLFFGYPFPLYTKRLFDRKRPLR